MSLNHCILHKIERTAPGGDITLALKADENNSSGPIFSLFEQLKHSFQRSSQKQFGHFDPNLEDNPLPAWIKQQQEDKIAFHSFSQRYVEDLKIKLDDSEDAFSAHILVAQETIMEQSMLYIFWINHVESIYIDSNMEVANTRYIDTKKISFAIKLDLEEWLEQNSPKYLSMITSRGDKVITDAFSRSIGFGSGVDTVKETTSFLAIVDQYTETLPEEKAVETKTKVLDYCVEQDKRGEPVVFEEISQQINEAAPLEFSSFVSDQQETPSPTLNTDRGSLKRYMRFFGRDKNISISFSSDLFGEHIRFEPESGRLTISAVPKSLKQQLIKHNSPISDDS